MARYISSSDSLQLYNRNGTVRHQFVRGELIVGSAACDVGAANLIDATLYAADEGGSIQWINAANLAGTAAAYSAEMAGQGALDKAADSGGLTNIEDGYKGPGFTATFFKALTKTSTTHAVVAGPGIWYKVLTGTTIYNGTTYTAGQYFESAAGVTATTGSGTFRLAIPPALNPKWDENLDAEFAIKHLNDGTEVASEHFLWKDGGFEPYDSATCTDTDFLGKVNY